MKVYTGVPTDQFESTNKIATKDRSHLIKNTILLALLLTGFHIGTKLHWLKNKKYEKSPGPTLLPGGGRDWVLDVANGIITCKHDSKFALGSLLHDPLVLTTREDDNVVYFPQEELSKLQDEGSVTLSSLALQFPTHVDTFSHWDYKLGGVYNEGGDGQGLDVQYVDSNFILFQGEYALDVSFWKMVKGSAVNFVKVKESTEWKWWEKKQKTLEYGGGRDWILNLNDGTISPKGYPSLVLGRGVRSLALIDMDSNPDGVWHFDNLDKLENGGVINLVNNKNEGYVAKMQEEEQYFEEWRYILSQIVEDEEDAIQVKYVDENYLAVYEDGQDEEKALVLDVSFWRMEPYNTVNFVGGWVYTAE